MAVTGGGHEWAVIGGPNITDPAYRDVSRARESGYGGNGD